MFNNNNEKDRINIGDNNPAFHLNKMIYEKLEDLNFNLNKELIIVCIGTDRSTGDCLGPLTGSLLKKNNKTNISIWGDVNNPVHARNLDKTINIIEKKYKNPFIIAIDAGLGKKSSVGCIDVKKGPLKPGTGVNKKLTKIGDMHITGLVNVGGYMEYLVLQSTRLSIVLKMARIISTGLELTIKNLYENKRVVD